MSDKQQMSTVGFCGLSLMAIAVLLLLGSWFITATPPDPPAGGSEDFAGSYAYSEAVARHTKSLAVKLQVSWVAELLLKGGFFMWLTGLILDRMPTKSKSGE